MVWYKRVIDLKLKWTKIAAFVGHGRTPRDCAERYKVCHDVVMKKRMLEQENKKSSIVEPVENEVLNHYDNVVGMKHLEPSAFNKTENLSSSTKSVGGSQTSAQNSKLSMKEIIEVQNLDLKNINLIQITSLK